jgi:hypothetical protein
VELVNGLCCTMRGYRVQFPAVAGNFSLHHRIQTGFRAHPASYPLGTGSSFPGGKAAGIVKLTTHLHLVPRPRMHGALYLYSLISLHGVVLS